MKVTVAIKSKNGSLTVNYEDKPENHGLNPEISEEEFRSYCERWIKEDPGGWWEMTETIIEPEWEECTVSIDMKGR
jgi:hypothetical protein